MLRSRTYVLDTPYLKCWLLPRT